MNKWSANLVRNTLSEDLIEEAIDNATKSLDPPIVSTLRKPCETGKDVSKLRKALKSIKSSIPEDVYGSLQDEFSEIVDDVSWAKTGHGKYVIEINDWVQTFHPAIRCDARFDDIYVGGHARMRVVYITGKIASQEHLNDFLELVIDNRPPWKIHTNVAIVG